MSGEVFSIGPLRTTWIAALLLVAGVGLVALRLVAPREEQRRAASGTKAPSASNERSTLRVQNGH